MPKIITESEVEQVALEILAGLGYQVVYGPDIAKRIKSEAVNMRGKYAVV